MIEIKIPEQNKKIVEQVQQVCANNKGLVVVASNDYNWNTYMTWVLVNELNVDRSKTVVLISVEEDQYKPERQIDTVAIDSLAPDNIVFACAIRDKEKVLDVIRAAETCLVIAIMHCSSGSAVADRFRDYEISESDIEQKLKIVICQEGVVQ